MPGIKNFRTHPFELFGKSFSIGGMAGPHNNEEAGTHDDPKGVDWALRELKNTFNMNVIIGLHEEFDYTENAKKAGLEYYYIRLNDFAKGTSPKIYDEIYKIVKESVQKGKNLTIHCGSGDGRTGTSLVTLKLRELIEKESINNPDILDERPPSDDAFSVRPGRVAFCTPLVRQAVLETRENYIRLGTDVTAYKIVETQDDVDILQNYEIHLKKLIKEERMKKKEKTGDTKLLSEVGLFPGGDNMDNAPMQTELHKSSKKG